MTFWKFILLVGPLLDTQAVATPTAVSGGQDTAVKEQGQELQTLHQVEQMSNILLSKFYNSWIKIATVLKMYPLFASGIVSL